MGRRKKKRGRGGIGAREDDDGGGNQAEKEKETKRGDFTPVGQEEKEAKNVRFREKNVLPSEPPNTFDTEFKRKRFYDSPRTKKNKG